MKCHKSKSRRWYVKCLESKCNRSSRERLTTTTTDDDDGRRRRTTDDGRRRRRRRRRRTDVCWKSDGRLTDVTFHLIPCSLDYSICLNPRTVEYDRQLASKLVNGRCRASTKIVDRRRSSMIDDRRRRRRRRLSSVVRRPSSVVRRRPSSSVVVVVVRRRRRCRCRLSTQPFI